MNPGLVGRDAEVAKVRAFPGCVRAPAVLVITGDAGIGKTVVWRRALQAALRPRLT